MTENQPLRTFVIYARDDKEYKNQLLRHLKPLIGNGYLKVWHDGDILPGEDWEKKIKDNLLASELVLVLVSVNCLNSDFIEGDELGTAVARLHKGHTRIVPIIISPCVWRVHKIFNGLQGLPEDMKPVSNWINQDSAWTNVAESLITIVEETRAEQADAARRQHELAEKQRLEAIVTAKEARDKAEQAERERLTREIQEREAAEQKRREEEQKQRLADESAQKAAAERARREQQAEMQRRENEAWQVALADNTPDAFKDFATRHHNSPLTHEALRRAKARRHGSDSGSKRLVFIGLGTVLAIALAVWLWPSSRQTESKPDGKEQGIKPAPNAEPAAWSQAQQSNNLAAYRGYIKDYPSGIHVSLARIRIGEFKDSAKIYLPDAERLYKNGKHSAAKRTLRKILDEFDPDNERAKELIGRMPKD